MKSARRILFITILTIAAIFLFSTPARASLKDVRGSWAESAINDLRTSGVINGYPDGTFRPDQAVTRAEFAKMVVKVFELEPAKGRSFSDTKSHWAASFINAVSQDYMTGYKDGTFRPDRNITRAEAVNVLTRIMRLGTDKEQPVKPWNPSFSDVSEKHWAFVPVEISKRLGILPNYESQFRPDRVLRRDETAWILSKTGKLDIVTGKVSRVEAASGYLTVNPASGDPVQAQVDMDTSLFRNNVGSELKSILNGDEIRVVMDPSGTARYVKAYGEVNSNDVAARASSYLKGQLTPDQIRSIIAGDWDSVQSNFKAGLYDQLMEYGATPAEAESILMADWESLSLLGRERLAASIAAELNLSPELVTIIMSQNLVDLQQLASSPMASGLIDQLLQMLPSWW